ncbi:hypothetical protein [Streptomyces sp. NBC_00343]|uniref:hypothetical protein n=1 Tax=Streptomyces sp. NBC_00343 TaxID=2975719 RepID=UPI002E27CB05|nr:hypothetical protein [Streptomyces sp. NBC_00343]
MSERVDDGVDRTLEALGLARAPREDPLTYPGAWPAESGLLVGDRLLPLDDDHSTYENRTPVLAIGSNASPGQLRHKLAEFGITSPVPMVKVRVTGIDVGVSAHVSRVGYVSASPVNSPGVVRELFVTWFDTRQLAVVDASERAYDRAWLPGSGSVSASVSGPGSGPKFRCELDSGESLRGAYVYVNRHGVLHDGTGVPRRHPGERALLTELLRGSARLRALFGRTPAEFCERARGDRELCERGTRLFREEGLVTVSGLERLVRPQQTGSPGIGSSLSPPFK